MSRTIQSLYNQPGGSVDVYDALADAFRRAFRGMLAPGKDGPAELGDPHSWEQRRDSWIAFLSALGPSDKACLIEVQRMRDER